MTAALVSQRFGMQKCIKEDSIPYLKNWLDSLKQDPSFIKSVLQDVKKASSMINQHIDKVQMEIDQEKEHKQSQGQSEGSKEDRQTVKDLGMYDVPVWSLPYIVNGDAEGMSDEEKDIVDKFLDKHFPDGFIPEVVEGSEKDFNVLPAFGTRNPNALPSHGESPYQAVETVSVKFSQAGYFEARSGEKPDYAPDVIVDNTKEEVAAKMPPKVEEKQEEDSGYHFHR